MKGRRLILRTFPLSQRSHLTVGEAASHLQSLGYQVSPPSSGSSSARASSNLLIGLRGTTALSTRRPSRSPYFAYANMLCDGAWVREGRRVEIRSPNDVGSQPARPRDPYQEQIRAAFPEFFIEHNRELCCQTCVNYVAEQGLCRHWDQLVEPQLPMCEAYIPREDPRSHG
jgi:hypothetical protein